MRGLLVVQSFLEKYEKHKAVESHYTHLNKVTENT